MIYTLNIKTTMFTGIIEKLGKVESLTKNKLSHKLCIDFDGFSSSLGEVFVLTGYAFNG